MQLRYYVTIMRRFWLLIMLLPVLTGAITLLVELRQPQRYAATARAIITQTPTLRDPQAGFPDFNLNYSWLNSEFVLDDLPQVVSSMAFAQDASALATAQGYALDPGTVLAGLSVQSFHRTVTFSARASTPEAAVAILRGALAALEEHGLKYWNRATDENNGLNVALLDQPTGAVPLHSRRQVVSQVAARMMLALVAAIALAFVLHYLDDRLREPRQVEEWMGLQVVGVIPRE